MTDVYQVFASMLLLMFYCIIGHIAWSLIRSIIDESKPEKKRLDYADKEWLRRD